MIVVGNHLIDSPYESVILTACCILILDVYSCTCSEFIHPEMTTQPERSCLSRENIKTDIAEIAYGALSCIRAFVTLFDGESTSQLSLKLIPYFNGLLSKTKQVLKTLKCLIAAGRECGPPQQPRLDCTCWANGRPIPRK